MSLRQLKGSVTAVILMTGALGAAATELASVGAVLREARAGAREFPAVDGGVAVADEAERRGVGGSAAPLPEGSFKGTTPALRSPDVMALFLKKDPANPDAHYAVLAEYDRRTGRVGPDRLALTIWVNRMYAYRLERANQIVYVMKPLRVSPAGDIEIDGAAGPDSLLLAKPGTLDGAVLTRYDRTSRTVAETIKFKGKLGSTWEPYVEGTFFGTTDRSGRDYFGKGVNMSLSKDGVAKFFREEIQGEYGVSEKAPGMFTFRARRPDNKGDDKVVTRIGVFIDIVNWKPLFTTDEFLLINPDDPADVGFYYERH